MFAASIRSLMVMTLVAVLCGCEEKKMDMADAMAPPPRPAELDRLNAWVGTWHSEGKMTMFNGGEHTMQAEGVNHTQWACDGRVIFEEMEYSMGEGERMTAIGIWTWDDKAKKYRSWWFDSHGGQGTGESEYDEENGEWEMTSRSRNPLTGHQTYGEGEVRFLSDDTMEWDFTEWDSLKITKIMEMKGSSRRQSDASPPESNVGSGSTMTPE